ncbi:MAG: hypothetical protein VX556_02445 [Pseudomonadota bacterium]|nr:hypothetical protein [Pseudomonadota bacterium]
MWQALIGPACDLLGGWLKSKAETKAAETRAKLAMAEAEAEVMKVAATHEAGWEKIMAQGSQNSWKDEWLVGLFSIPLILSFCGEWGRTIVAEGFAALETMPNWYQYTLGVIVAASFGVRSATKFFGKK